MKTTLYMILISVIIMVGFNLWDRYVRKDDNDEK